MSIMQALPIPPSKQEESDLLQRIGKGDESAVGELVSRNLRLVVYVASKYRNSGAEFDDIFSAGTIGLLKAVRTYDASKNIKFSYYAALSAQNEIRMFLRGQRRHRREVSMGSVFYEGKDGSEISLFDTLVGDDGDYIAPFVEQDDVEEKREILNAYLERNPKYKRVIELLPYHSQAEIATKVGFSQAHISRIVRKAKDRITEMMRERERAYK
jgi:RNA polymerase sporulation-specific sigma factor